MASQSAVRRDDVVGVGFMYWLAQAGEILPPWWSKARDKQLLMDIEYAYLRTADNWFVDDNPVRGGKYTLIYDKITKFDLLYFPIPEENVDGKGLKDWDTRVKKKLPYAIVLEIGFDAEEHKGDAIEESEEHISRIIVLKGAYNVAPQSAPGQGNPAPTPAPTPGR